MNLTGRLSRAFVDELRCTCVVPDHVLDWKHGPKCPANPHPGCWTCPVCGRWTPGSTARARRALRRRCRHSFFVPPPRARRRRR